MSLFVAGAVFGELQCDVSWKGQYLVKLYRTFDVLLLSNMNVLVTSRFVFYRLLRAMCWTSNTL